METIMGRCEYCGAEIGVIAETQVEANEIASEKCDCYDAQVAEKKRRMSECLRELAGADCEELGFRPVEDKIFNIIEKTAHMIIEGRIQNAVFKISGTIITIKGGEKIKASRKYTYEQNEEIK